MALGVISLERHRPMSRCAADRAKPVAAAPQVLHDVDWMHPQAVGERPYGNSLGVSEDDDVGVGHFALSRLLNSAHATKERRWQTTCGETAPGLPASFGHFVAFCGLIRRVRAPLPAADERPDAVAECASEKASRWTRRSPSCASKSRRPRRLTPPSRRSGQDEALSGKESRPTIFSGWGITLDQFLVAKVLGLKGCLTVPGECR